MNNNNNNIPCIALVGNAPADKCEVLNNILDEEGLTDVCDIILYGADGQPEEEALLDAIEDYQDGKVNGIVCLPMKESLATAFDKALNTLSEEVDTAVNMVPLKIHSTARLASVKGDMDIADTAASLKKEDIIDTVKTLSKALKRDLSILNPRIAVTSLNKEIATNETSEELNIIAPAVSDLVNSGIQAFGPVESGTIFDNAEFMAYDAILSMYDSQVGDEFLKASNESAVTLLAGFDKFTNRGMDIPVAQAEAEDIFKACCLVSDVARNRREYDRPFRNPLQKLYHERKEDGDKARFAMKKKGFNPAEHRRENVTFITMPKKDSVKE